MRPGRVTTLSALALLSAACGTQDALPGGTAESAARPELTIVSTSPLTARGRGFRPNERVKLLATGRGVESKTVKATELGGFTVRFRLSPGGGDSAAVQAIGSRGSRAMIDITQPDVTPP
jgi:hypothetical protein